MSSAYADTKDLPVIGGSLSNSLRVTTVVGAAMALALTLLVLAPPLFGVQSANGLPEEVSISGP